MNNIADIENREEDEFLYELVLTELENDYRLKGLWAKAIAMSEGNDKRVEPLYMQYRVQNMKDEMTRLGMSYKRYRLEVLEAILKSLNQMVPNNLEKQEENLDEYVDRRLKELNRDLSQER